MANALLNDVDGVTICGRGLATSVAAANERDKWQDVIWTPDSLPPTYLR